MTNQRRIKEREILLRQHFFKTQEIYTPGNLDKFLIGLASQPSQNAENFFTQEVNLIITISYLYFNMLMVLLFMSQVTNHLFEKQGKGFGLDLVALNIQRGRDHGKNKYYICKRKRLLSVKIYLSISRFENL